MLGVDPYWERIHLAYGFEVEERTKTCRDTDPVFYPGEIAHIENDGTLSSCFYDFLEWQGMPLTRKEMTIKRRLSRQSFGRDCVILQRLDNNRYIVCYLTSFNQAQHSQNIHSLLGKLFAIAIDDTPEYPPGTPSIKMNPKWAGYGFLYAIPVPRQNLVRHKALNSRFMLRMGELERVKQLVAERVTVFKSHEKLIREESLRWRNKPQDISDAQRAADEVTDNAADEPTTLTASADDLEAPSESTLGISTSTFSRPERAAASPPASHIPASHIRAPPKLPRIHYLQANEHWHNLRWMLINIHLDMRSSYYRPNIISIGRLVYESTAPVLRRLPMR